MSPEPPSGSRCFVDANILVYYFVNNPLYSAPCDGFFRRVAAGDLLGFTSPMMISEALHRIMLSDVQVQFSTTKPLAYIQRHPHLIRQLTLYRLASQTLDRLGLSILPVHIALFASAVGVAQTHSLLTDDASTVALMQREALQILITNDDDFDAIPGIIVCKPR